MVWEFETDPEFEAQLEWMRDFVQEEVEPLDVLWPDDVYKMPQSEEIKLLLRPLKSRFVTVACGRLISVPTWVARDTDR